MKKILELAAKYWPETGKWLVGAIAVIVVVEAIKRIGIPVQDYGKIGAERVFEFVEQYFPRWPFLVFGIVLGRLFLGDLTLKIVKSYVYTRTPLPADPKAEVRRIMGRYLRIAPVVLLALLALLLIFTR